jgi:hypothetical protein
MAKKPSLIYGGRRPKGFLLAHNSVAHDKDTPHGECGFRRFWIPPQWVAGNGWVKCPCGWRGVEHYALNAKERPL